MPVPAGAGTQAGLGRRAAEAGGPDLHALHAGAHLLRCHGNQLQASHLRHHATGEAAALPHLRTHSPQDALPALPGYKSLPEFLLGIMETGGGELLLSVWTP